MRHLTTLARKRKVGFWEDIFLHYLHCRGGRRPEKGSKGVPNHIGIMTKQFNNYLYDLGMEDRKMSTPQMRCLLKYLGYVTGHLLIEGKKPIMVVYTRSYVVPYMLTYELNKGKRTGRNPKICPPIVKEMLNPSRYSSRSDTLRQIQDQLTKHLDSLESKEDSGQ